MGDSLLAWRNVWRNPRRSVLTILAIIFATTLLVFMLSFQFGAYEEMISSSVRLSTGHLQVLPKGYLDRPEMRRVINEPGPLLKKIDGLAAIAGVAARSEAFALAAGPKRSRGMMISGVWPEKELLVSSLPDQVIEGRYLQTGDAGMAVMGVLGAERLQLGVGDECTLLGQGRDGSVAATVVTIIGIFRTGIDEVDRSAMQLTSDYFDEVFSMEGSVHRVVMFVKNLSDAEAIASTLRMEPEAAGLEVLTWDELAPGLKQSIELDLISGIITYAILVIVVSFSILNTFFMAIFERTREFGMLMSIGTKPLRLMKMMLLESMAMTMVGLVLGIILGVAITLFFADYGISMGGGSDLMAQYGMADRLYPRLSFWSVAIGPAIICVVTFFTALIPTLKIPRMKPVEALRAC